MRSTSRAGVLLSALALGLIVTLCGGPAWADLIPSSPVSTAAPSADATPVSARLEAAGLSPEQVAQRMHEMDPADLAVLAENPEQVQCAGSVGTIALIAGAVILLAVILYLILQEKM